MVWAARYELARTVEDVLARRVRLLILDAAAALRVAPTVAALLAQELGLDEAWQARQVAEFQRAGAWVFVGLNGLLYDRRTSC